MNKTFKVTINWHGEFIIHYTTCKSKEQALKNSLHNLSERYRINLTTVRAKVLAKPNSYLTEEI